MSQSLIIQKQGRVRWKVPYSDSEIQSLASAMLDAAGMAHVRAELSILDDAAMAALHRQSLGCRGPTNILSFPASGLMEEAQEGRCFQIAGRGGEGTAETFLGWLALSADTLQRESFLYGQDVGDHCVHLLAHGMAHLMGHDHGPAMDALCLRLEAAAHARVSGAAG